MIWVIIACTLLIIVCLGGGERLGQIIGGAILTLAVIIAATQWSVIGTLMILGGIAALRFFFVGLTKLHAWEVSRREIDGTPL